MPTQTIREMFLRASRPNLGIDPVTGQGLKRPLLTTPDELGPCQEYCELLKAEIWRLDRRWASLKADLFDADRQGGGVDTASFIRAAEAREE